MSADAVPAAAPGPNDPAGTTPAPGPITGLLASMVAPVEPARPTFNLAPATAATPDQTAPQGGMNPAPGNVSSASFHDEEGTVGDTKNSANNSGSGKAQTGIWRAWLIAGATRWGRGGGTANKRLDMKKAKAQAQQVKETRAVTINRTPAASTGGGRSSNASGPAGGKGLSGKSGSGGASTGPKNAEPGSKDKSRGPSGRDTKGGNGGAGAGSGRGPSGGGNSTTGPKNGPAPKQQKLSKPDTAHNPKPSKTSTGTDQKAPKTSAGAGGAAGAKGSAGSTGKDGATPKTPTPAKGPTSTPDTKTAGTRTAKDTKGGPDSPDRKKTSLTKDDKTAKDGTKTDPAADKKLTSSKDKPAAVDGEKKDTDKPADGKQKPDTTGGKPDAGKGKPFSTKESRATGYRDGTRVAKVNAHAKAYTDGVKDGWTDVIEAAEREKTRLDKAHALRKQQLEQEREQPVTATSADHHQAQPIEVTGVDEKNIYFGAGAARESLTRGEVRSLKVFERRLEAKVSVLLKSAEQARTLQAHAGEQGKEATQLLEQARGSKAGEKVIGSLLKTQEATAAQIRAAEDLYKRAIRGAEQSSAVLANVKTRYGAMYAAVVNSPETKPAEMSFYQDGALTNA
ncbi:hypothetical protein [Streptomyces sp. NBC_00842]|uniref:hypothetical protein n=1 Tax=Streptomyces sp. NBC_00842 TaxID=2975848 RepID=UPI002F91608A|nr:hypothetical protein OH821_45015 [Streptomyces sp. NBC_00842]